MVPRTLVFLTLCYAAKFLIAADAKPVEQPFHKELLQIAAEYKKWGRVDDEARWAPFLCRSPMAARAVESASDDQKTHGRKLYSLFAKDQQSYEAITQTKKSKPGQVIVKQSWIPEEVSGDTAERVKKHAAYPQAHETKLVQVEITGDKSKPTYESFDHFFPYVVKEDKVFKASKQADLFIMMKLDPKTADTDEGWVYGTVTPDGKTVTAAGKIESCMKCHVKAKHDRLFGLPE